MKATHFRIGNYVEYDNRIFQIDTLAKEFPTLNTAEFGIGVVDWNNLQPIPLTEQWLLDLGALNPNPTIFCFDRFELIWKESYKYWYVLDLFSSTYLTKISNVHEWQNFVFAMNGQELTLKQEL